MNNLTDAFFSSQNFMPHGHCFLWQSDLLLLHVISDACIALAYYSIPVTLIYFVRKRKDLEFHWMFICFAIFILACGTAHLMEILTIWHPVYWLSGTIKAITALASIPTAFLLVKVIPLALALPSPSALKALNDQMAFEISERKQAELVLNEKNIELNQLNEDLEAFNYSVSHDLRAPLRSMDGFSLALLEDYDDKLDTDGKDALNRIRAASQHMGALIDDMLRLSHITRLEMKFEQMDLSVLTQKIAHTLSEETLGRSVEWVIEDGMQLKTDTALMSIVMQNLIENAWKYSSKTNKAIIRVGTSERDGSKVFFVADNGAGFNMAHSNRLFTAFQRLHQTSDYPGTGIGLTIVKRIIGRLGGEIWVDAKEGAGATFYFNVKESNNDLSNEINLAR